MTPFAVFTEPLAAGAALAAVGVPLLIHLLFRKRYQIVPWAAIRFLLVAERRHRRRIDQWLLLALRALALLLPLLAMIAATKWTEPLWQAIKPGATETIANVPRTHHILVLDASLSMTTRTEDGQTRFAKAVAQAESVLHAAGPGDGFTLLVLAGGVQHAVPGPSNDPEKVIAELRQVKPTHAAADCATAVSAVHDAIGRGKRAYPRRQVTFLTDFQRSAWANVLPRADAELSEAAKQVFRKPDVDVVIVDLARADVDNLAVADVSLADTLPFVDSAGGVSAVIANHGRTEKRDVRVQLFLGRPSAGSDALVPVEQQTIKVIAPGSRAPLTFGLEGQVKFREKGIHVVQVKLLEPDELPADDSRAVAVEVREGLRAVLVEGKPDPVPSRAGAQSLARALLPRKDESKPFTPARPDVRSVASFLEMSGAEAAQVDCVYLCDLATITPDLVLKLEAVLKRGGGVVIGLGPNAAINRAAYNRLLFNDGNGILPNPLGEVVTATGPNDLGFRLSAEEDEYLRAPLQFFRNERVRGGLIMAPFKSYIRLAPLPRKAPLNPPSPEPLAEGPARRVLSFVPANAAGAATQKPDAALVEWSKHRGRVVVFTSSFNEDWNDWAPLPAYLMFHQELLRFAAASPDRHTVGVGDAIEEFYPPSVAGRVAALAGPEGIGASLTLKLQDEAGVASYADTRLSGLYRVRLEGNPDRVFAVNVPEGATGAPSESDLKRLDRTELKPLGPVQAVGTASEIVPTAESGADVTTAPKPHGPVIARFAVVAVLVVLLAEMLIAWRMGPARVAAGGAVRPVERKLILRVLSTLGALLPLAVAGFLLFTLVHNERTGELLGFLPTSARQEVESLAGVPAAQPGEGTKWRLEALTAFVRNGLTDRRITIALAVLVVGLTLVTYRLERRAVSTFTRLVVPVLLRTSVFLLALFVLLPQVKLVFDREGWPEIVILIDTSGSMGTADDFKDAAVRAKAEELVGVAGLGRTDRLKLAQALLARKTNGNDWLDRLLKGKEVKVHLYAVDATTRPLASLDEPAHADDGRAALAKLVPDGDASRLGDGVEAVLKAFRGSSLAAIVMFTDGVTTAGDDLPKAARSAAAAGVPLFLVGVGDAWERPDLELTDLQAEDTVTVGDRLVFDARLIARGQIPPGPVTVTLTEKGVPADKARRATVTITPDAAGNPVPVTLAHTPMEPGEKTFVLEVPAVEGETNKVNNRIERTVLVTDSKRVRVLYVEGYPRYDFRFVKVLLERESDRSIGGKGVEIKVVLLDASKGWETTDKSAYQSGMPTREELFGFDVVILGDVDPKQFARATGVLQNLADFVKVKGGGLLFLCGEHGTPAAFADTPIAEILPVTPEPTAAARDPEDAAITEGFRPKVTAAGRQHPLFRFSPDDAENTALWNRLQPLYWYAKGYKRKPNTVVLATHPDRPAEGGGGEPHPLVVQTFAGTGPVMFFGFDDTWRWRFRNDEEYFDRFWVQTVRVLAQARVRRVEFVSPKGEFRRDEKVTVAVRFPVEAPAPGAGQAVRVGLVRGTLPNPDGTPGTGPSEATTLTLARAQGPGVQFETTLTHTPEGEYRFTLLNPESPPGLTPPTTIARVLPPMGERDRVELNKADLIAAANLSSGGFYTLATADRVFDDLKNLQRVTLNQPCPPVEVWNSPFVYLLLVLLLASEWMLRKRERLL